MFSLQPLLKFNLKTTHAILITTFNVLLAHALHYNINIDLLQQLHITRAHWDKLHTP